MKFPIDEVRGNTVQGSASYVTGVRGVALYIDGQMGSRVAYGTYTEGCFLILSNVIE